MQETHPRVYRILTLTSRVRALKPTPEDWPDLCARARTASASQVQPQSLDDDDDDAAAAAAATNMLHLLEGLTVENERLSRLPTVPPSIVRHILLHL